MPSRFPELKSSSSNGAPVEPLLRKMVRVSKQAASGLRREILVDIVKRSIHISPFWEEDSGVFAELLGNRTCFGSDFPHPEVSRPGMRIDDLAYLPDELQRKIKGRQPLRPTTSRPRSLRMSRSDRAWDLRRSCSSSWSVPMTEGRWTDRTLGATVAGAAGAAQRRPVQDPLGKSGF